MAALLAYIAVRTDPPGPLFVYKDGSPLTRDKLVVAVRQALEQAGHTASKYSGHRIGAAAQAGLEDSLIKMLGRWESAAYQRYIRTSKDTLTVLSVRLVAPIT